MSDIAVASHYPGPTQIGVRVEPKALHKANRRFQSRMRWLKRKAYNDA